MLPVERTITCMTSRGSSCLGFPCATHEMCVMEDQNIHNSKKTANCETFTLSARASRKVLL